MAALALACAAAGGGATSAALAQSAPDQPGQPPRPAPRAVQVTPHGVQAQPAPDPSPDAPSQPPATPGDERRRAIELYRAQFGGQLTKAPYLGVSTSAVPGALRQHLGLAEGIGLVVDFVEPDSPAQKAGLKQYDILTKLDDQILVNAQQLAVVVRTHKGGEEVRLTLLRGGKEQTLKAKLVEKEVKPIGDLFDGWGGTGPLEADERALQHSVVERMRERRNRQEDGRQPPVDAQQRSGGRTMSVWRDNDMTVTITRRDGDKGRHVVAVGNDGKKLFEGNIDDDKERSAMPPAVADKVRQMESKLPPEAKNDGNGQSRGNAHNNREVRSGQSVNANRNNNRNGEDEDEDEVEERSADDESAGESARRGPIGNNDVLSIALRDVHGPGTKTVKTARVRDGRVDLPMVAPVECVGLTEDELEKQIVTAYAKVNPSVSVQVKRVARVDGKDKP
jgi:hypothetical protein